MQFSSEPSPLSTLRAGMADGSKSAGGVANVCAERANGSASHNTYIHFNHAELLEHAASLNPAGELYGVPISLKDCFDVAGLTTTFGSGFYARHNSPALFDSEMAERLRAAGCLITGKTHLHPLAYGITGQNPDFGDALQPRDAALLTGGSSSGAAASVQEGSALAAIGTDTGGSIRVPAALCGLVGYRASHALGSTGIWQGAAHLAPSFDTIGLLVKDARDLAPIAQALFGIRPAPAPRSPRIGCVPVSWIEDAEPDVLTGYAAWKQHLAKSSAILSDVNIDWWQDSMDIFAPIQASEAAVIHRGHFEEFEPAITQRLEWGASFTTEELESLKQRLAKFRHRMAKLLAGFEFLLMPCAPVARLRAADDHSRTRTRILRYTTPFSLTGLPVVAVPGEQIGAPFGTGVQLASAQGADGELLAFAATL